AGLSGAVRRIAGASPSNNETFERYAAALAFNGIRATPESKRRTATTATPRRRLSDDAPSFFGTNVSLSIASFLAAAGPEIGKVRRTFPGATAPSCSVVPSSVIETCAGTRGGTVRMISRRSPVSAGKTTVASPLVQRQDRSGPSSSG